MSVFLPEIYGAERQVKRYFRKLSKRLKFENDSNMFHFFFVQISSHPWLQAINQNNAANWETNPNYCKNVNFTVQHSLLQISIKIYSNDII